MASGGFYSYQFPLINTDSSINYPSAAGIIKKITAEEWADMQHHTHKITDITDENGNRLDSGSISISAYDDTEIRNLITQMQYQITALVQENNSLKERLTAVENSSSNDNGFIIDYDVDQQGTQDINGDPVEI